jgi:pyruvate dehydrogenase E2 component (dihydrolipoamide acetyltransferase)
MPSLGADMERGTLLEWRVKPGDPVRRGDIVAVVDTEKSTIEIEVFEDGIIESIVVPEGDEVPVGTVLAMIATGAAPAVTPAAAPAPTPQTAFGQSRGASDARLADTPKREAAAAVGAGPAAAPLVTSPVVRHLAEQLDVDVTHVAATGAGRRVTRADVERAAARHIASPYARRLARECGIDVATNSGSGPGGAVLARDLGAAPAAPATPATKDRAATMRHAIAELMARSNREIPHFYLRTTIDVAAAMSWLERHNADRSIADRVLPAALLTKAVAVAARDVHGLNGTWTDDGFVDAGAVHVGLVVSLRSGGVVVPAIRDTDALPVDDLMGALRDIVNRARDGRLRASEVAAPTITVTNLGDQGVDEVFGVIYPPQVALVGFGAVRDQPRAVGGAVEVRPVVVATLAADHRACDGRLGAKFLDTIDRLLQEPEAL